MHLGNNSGLPWIGCMLLIVKLPISTLLNFNDVRSKVRQRLLK